MLWNISKSFLWLPIIFRNVGLDILYISVNPRLRTLTFEGSPVKNWYYPIVSPF